MIWTYLLGEGVELPMMVACYSDTKFLNFLHKELSLSTADIAVALRHRELSRGPLSMLLWQYGLVNMEQLERIFDWLENQI